MTGSFDTGEPVVRGRFPAAVDGARTADHGLLSKIRRRLPVPTADGPSKIDRPAVTATKIKVHSPSIRPAPFPQVVLAADKKAPHSRRCHSAYEQKRIRHVDVLAKDRMQFDAVGRDPGLAGRPVEEAAAAERGPTIESVPVVRQGAPQPGGFRRLSGDARLHRFPATVPEGVRSSSA